MLSRDTCFVHYRHKEFYNIGDRCQCYSLFFIFRLDTISMTSFPTKSNVCGVSPGDFPHPWKVHQYIRLTSITVGWKGFPGTHVSYITDTKSFITLGTGAYVILHFCTLWMDKISLARFSAWSNVFGVSTGDLPHPLLSKVLQSSRLWPYKHYTRLERLSRDTRFAHYRHKEFFTTLGTGANVIQQFLYLMNGQNKPSKLFSLV